MTVMLEGLLVDLVPYGDAFEKLEHTWLNDRGVYFWTMGAHWLPTRASLERHRQEDQENESRNETRVRFGMQTKDGTPIGLIAANWVLPHHRLAMLSALIGDPDYWGGGYGTDALLLFVDYVFEWLDMRKVWLMTMVGNDRVVRQMEKVGFTLEGNPRDATWIDGTWRDALIYGMPREAWLGRAALVERLGLTAR